MSERTDETNSNPRVLYVVWTYPKYSETFVRNEVHGLRGDGVDVRVATVGAGEYELEGAEEALVVRLTKLPALPRPTDLGAFRTYRDDDLLTRVWAPLAARRLVSALAGWRPDVVHAHFIDKPAILALQTGRLLDVPVTVTAHARDYLCHVSPKVLAERVAAVSKTFTISDRAAVEIRELVRGHGLASPALQLIRATASLNPGIATVPDRPYAISIARLVEKKGIDVAIDAFSAVSNAFPDLHYVIVGDGPERAGLEALAVKRNVADRVHFFGSRPSSEAQRLLAAAVALLLPCRRSSDGDADGIPVVLMEAGLAGTPVITTDIGGIAELVEADVGGLIVSPDDVTEVSAALRSIVENPLQARTYAEALRRRMTEEFNDGLQRDRLVGAWGEVIRR